MVLNDELVYKPINFFSGDSWSDRCMANITSFSCKETRRSDAFNLLWRVDRDGSIGELLKVLVRLSSCSIVWLFDFLWNMTMFSKAIREWSCSSSIDGGLLLRGLSWLSMTELVEFPEALETLLATEICRFETQHKACWTLHSGFVGAVRSGTRTTCLLLLTLDEFLF